MVINPATLATSKPSAEAVEARFRRLAGEWHDAVAYQSASSVRNSHPAYREIISLGEDIVPLLLRDLEENQTHWFSALREITGADPIPATAAGNIPQMIEAWLRLAKDNNFRW